MRSTRMPDACRPLVGARPAAWLCVLALAVTACGTPTVPRHAQMHRALPQRHAFGADAGRLWEALAAEVDEDPDRHVLARDDGSRLISWSEPFGTADLVFVRRMALFQDMRLDVDMTAIVSVRVEPGDDGSWAWIRCTVYPHDSVESISASRGSFEDMLVSDLAERLSR